MTTIKDVKNAMRAHAARHGKQSALDVLKDAGAKGVQHLKPEHYKEVIGVLEAELPPPMGRFRIFEFILREPKNGSEPQHGSMMIPGGMEVRVGLRAYYWAERKSFTDLYSKAKALNFPIKEFGMINADRQMVGQGDLTPSDGPHELAWLSCMLYEMRRVNLAFILPPEITDVPGTVVLNVNTDTLTGESVH